MTGAQKTHHPQDSANFASRVILWWIFPLLWKGTRNTLNQEDLYPIRDDEKSSQRTDVLENRWREEIISARTGGRKPKLWRAMSRFYSFQEYWHFVALGVTTVFSENITFFVTISLLDRLANFYSNQSHGEYYVYMYGMAIGLVVRSISQNNFILHHNVLGVKLRAAVLGMLYKKLLRVSKISLDSGYLMELVCSDTHKFITSSTWYVPYVLRHLSMAACLIAWLLYFIGWQIIPGALFIVTVGVIRLLLQEYDYKLRMRASQLSEERLGNIRETLTAMRSIKLNCWETIYEEKIKKSRWQEIQSKAIRWIIMLTSYSFISCGHHLSILITVLFLKTENIPYLNFFALITLFHQLSEKVCLCLTTAIRQITNINIALERIEVYLQISDFPNKTSSPKNVRQFNFKTSHDTFNEESVKTCSNSHISTKKHQILPQKTFVAREKHEPPWLSLYEITCKLPGQVACQSREMICTEILKGVTFNVNSPGLVLVCGPVGSGKSSLLATILGREFMVTNGSVEYSGTLAYVLDIPWVFPGTIRENILFGLPYNEKFYAEVIRVCQLEKDFRKFPQMDLALIGEHGATLSGGQRTRIALARAVYSQANIYLMDDPLSSLDAQVGENVFRYCIRGLLSDKIILLTTPNTRYYQEADHIIHLEDGKITELKDDLPLAEFEGLQKDTTQGEKESADHETSHDQNEISSGQSLKLQKEKREFGRVAFKVYKEYFLYGASIIVLFFFVLVFISGQGIIVLVDYLASRLPAQAGQGEESFNHALVLYIVCLTAGVVLLVLGTLCLFFILMNAACKIHNKMVSCLLNAPLSFHAINPVGRILNRFSQDISNIDELLPFQILMSALYVAPGIATIVLAIILNRLLIIPIAVALPIFYFFAKVFFTSATDIRRLMSIAGSPIYSHFSNTKEGLRIIRVYGRQEEFTDQAFRHIDEHHRAVLCNYTAIRWFACVFSSVCAMVTTIISFIVIYFVTDSTSAALGAVTILYAVNTTATIDYFIRIVGDVNSQMTSAERVLANTRIQPEDGQDLPKTPKNWPNAGEIEMKNASLWHYVGSPPALKNLTFKINLSEKVGIAGRTGAGKSSLVSALMRLAKTQGEILIDGLNIKDFNMLSTRKCISVISQLPTLINGTVRLNLDPLGEHTDAEIWSALQRTKMSTTIENLPQGLDSELKTDTSNFSVGEKQLLNMARVLLQNNKIVILDEATGKIDGNTNTKIQRIIGEDLKECTVITISHRLSTILSCDRVMVLDQGEIKEFDCPAILLKNPSGLLKQLEQMA